MGDIERRARLRMRTMVAAAFLLCAAAVSLAQVFGAQGPEGKAAAQQMYRVEEVAGMVLAAQRMYQEEGVQWYVSQVQVESVEGEGGKCQPGEVVAVRHEVGRGGSLYVPGLGDRVRAKLTPDAGSEQTGWLAVGGLEYLGRGEFVKPGEGAEVDLGSAEAKILVKMFAPLAPECHRTTADLLKELAEREPERVRVQIFNMMTRPGQAEMRRERLRCATVLVNNRYEFTLQTPDGPREVAFHHRPNGPKASYNSEDVIALVDQEIARLYPEEKE
jgi:hypothetical protein